MNALVARLTYEVSDEGCWLFTGCTDEHGYGRLGVDGKSRRAHRLAYEVWVGPIPDGLQVDHTCHNESECPGGPTCEHRRCLNPEHFVAATLGENVLSGKGIAANYARRSACKNGHEYTDENTRWSKTRTGTLARVCRTCRRNSQRRAA